MDKGHGRLEKRTLQTSTDLNDYADWSGVQQVFRLDREIINSKQAKCTPVYGITNLSPEQADARNSYTWYGDSEPSRIAVIGCAM